MNFLSNKLSNKKTKPDLGKERLCSKEFLWEGGKEPY